MANRGSIYGIAMGETEGGGQWCTTRKAPIPDSYRDVGAFLYSVLVLAYRCALKRIRFRLSSTSAFFCSAVRIPDWMLPRACDNIWARSAS
jgi:hypothetical protein